MWQVYILFSKRHRKTYIGSTNNFERRLDQHNKGQVESTKRYLPWIPIYTESYPTEATARHREKELKTTVGRRYLKKTINNIIEIWVGSSTG